MVRLNFQFFAAEYIVSNRQALYQLAILQPYLQISIFADDLARKSLARLAGGKDQRGHERTEIALG